MPKGIEIVKASAPSLKKEAEFSVDFGTDLAEMVALYGEDIVHERAGRAMKIESQAAARTMLMAEKEPIEVVNYMENTWKPGEGTDSQTSVINKFKGMTAEDQLEMLKQLEELRAKANQG